MEETKSNEDVINSLKPGDIVKYNLCKRYVEVKIDKKVNDNIIYIGNHRLNFFEDVIKEIWRKTDKDTMRCIFRKGR